MVENIEPDELIERVNTLDAQVQFCVDYMNERGILDDACLTFPDGETVWATRTIEASETKPSSHNVFDKGDQ